MVLWTLPNRVSVHVPPEPAAIVHAVGMLEHLGKEVYFGVLPRRPGTPKKGGNADVLDGAVLWLDLDVGADGHASKSNPPDVGSAV